MSDNSGPKEAVQTYIEQTKLLVALASAFVVAPAAMAPLLKTSLAALEDSNALTWFFVAEFSFVSSVLLGYVVLATIAGYQHKGKYDIYRKATRISSLAQIATYLVGLCVFVKFIGSLLELKGA